tara:strand:+ start:197 stop:358 length:162 start_codon:yes stop_codon:yes gene_type:complete
MKNQEIKNAINILDNVYANVMIVVRSDNDFETMNLIQPILDKIDELQNDLEKL